MSKKQDRCNCDIDDWYVVSDPDGIRKIICNNCEKDLLKAHYTSNEDVEKIEALKLKENITELGRKNEALRQRLKTIKESSK